MPIERVMKSMTQATQPIRRHWSHAEMVRRQAIAEKMQLQLLMALGYRLAPINK